MKASFIGLTSLRLAKRAPSSHPMKHRRSRAQRSPFVLLTLLALLSITCNFGGLLPGTAPFGKLTDPIVSIEPGASVDDNGQVVDATYTFAPTDPQMEVVVQVGNLSSPAAMTVTWLQVTDQGDQTLFTHTVQVSQLDRAFSIGKNPGTLAEGDYKIIAAINGQTHQIEVSVAQPVPSQIPQSVAASMPTNSSAGAPPVDGGSGKTSSAASSSMLPASAGCTIPLTVISNVAPNVILTVDSSQCPQPFTIGASVEEPGIFVAWSLPNIYSWRVDPCRSFSDGTDLPGTKIQLTAKAQSSVSFSEAPVLAGPMVITLGPDISPPHLKVKADPKPGKLKKGVKQIALDITAEEVRAGESWQTGVQDIKAYANRTPINSKDYLSLSGASCDAKSWTQSLKATYDVTSKSPPLITLCAYTEDFAGNWSKSCRDYINGDHWTGTIRSTTNADYGTAGTCTDEKWLFNLDIYVTSDGTVAGKGTGHLTSPANCHLPASPHFGDDPAHNATFDVSGKLDGQNFQLFFSETSIDSRTPGLINYSLLLSGTPLASDMPPFVFSIQGQGSAGGDVKIAYAPASDQEAHSVTAEHIVDMKCLDCGQ